MFGETEAHGEGLLTSMLVHFSLLSCLNSFISTRCAASAMVFFSCYVFFVVGVCEVEELGALYAGSVKRLSAQIGGSL